MSVPSRKSGTEVSPPNQSTALLLLATLGDTTWRMFVPTITGIVGGYSLDEWLGSTPWLFIGGIIIGCVIAGILIKQQLQKI